jgi:hypothetical protein
MGLGKICGMKVKVSTSLRHWELTCVKVKESIVGGHLEARREKSDHCSPGDRRHFGLPVDRATVMV